MTPIPKGPLSALESCLQLSTDFNNTSSVEGFAFWSLFGEIWGPVTPVISPVLIQKELGYL